MQKNYELVLMMDSKAQDSAYKELFAKFEDKYWSCVLEKDDIWVKSLSHDMKWVKGNDSAYLVSYFLKLEPKQVKEIKDFFVYENLAVRYEIISMKSEEVFWKFDKLQKELEDIIEGWDKKRFGARITFFSHKENEKYLTWKAIPMLKKYITRFGNIKPSKYTKNSVSRQKMVRKQIIRARTFWLLDFIME